MTTDKQMEWLIYEDHIDTFPRHKQLKPNGVYFDHSVGQCYQFFYGSITEAAELISSGKIPNLTP